MKDVNFAYIANKLLGDDLYCKFIKEVSKENNKDDLVDYGKVVFEKCCLLILSLGMSNVIKMDMVKINVGDEIIEVSCKEFAEKYKKYANQIESNILKTLQ